MLQSLGSAHLVKQPGTFAASDHVFGGVPLVVLMLRDPPRPGPMMPNAVPGEGQRPHKRAQVGEGIKKVRKPETLNLDLCPQTPRPDVEDVEGVGGWASAVRRAGLPDKGPTSVVR